MCGGGRRGPEAKQNGRSPPRFHSLLISDCSPSDAHARTAAGIQRQKRFRFCVRESLGLEGGANRWEQPTALEGGGVSQPSDRERLMSCQRWDGFEAAVIGSVKWKSPRKSLAGSGFHVRGSPVTSATSLNPTAANSATVFPRHFQQSTLLQKIFLSTSSKKRRPLFLQWLQTTLPQFVLTPRAARAGSKWESRFSFRGFAESL